MDEGRQRGKAMALPTVCIQCGSHNLPEDRWCHCGYDLDTKFEPINEKFFSSTGAPDDSLQKEETQHTGKSYIRRHWDGELSLSQAFWLNTMLVNFCISFVHTLSRMGDDLLLQTQVYVVTTTIQLVFILPWQCVGVWRSAKAHILKQRRYFWGRCAQVMCLSWVVSSIASLPVAIPMFYELSRIAVSAPDYSYTLTLRGKRGVEFNGGISYGASNELKDILKKNPTITIIALNSPGGLFNEAILIRDVVQKHKLTTITETGCASACTEIFMAGDNRIVFASDPQLGFHSAGFPGLFEWMMGAANERAKQYLITRGVSRKFADKAYNVPHADVWFPTMEELIEARVITHLFDGEQYIPVR